MHGSTERLQVGTDCQMQDEDQARKLNGFFLLRHSHAEDPTEVFSVNIDGQGFTDTCPEDFVLFDKVQCISASENRLHLEEFTTFTQLQELELPLNGMKNLKVKYGDFPYLQHLDLSFNNLSGNCLKSLGLMPNLLTLNLSGNSITELPVDFAKCFKLPNNLQYLRFPRLRILRLSYNKLWHPETFISLGTLPQLEHLDLRNNFLYHVPQLFNQNGKIGLYEDLLPRSILEECSASDLSDSNQSSSDKLSEEETVKAETEPIYEEVKIEPTQGDTNQFLDNLLSDIDDEESELMSDEFPTDFFGQEKFANLKTERDQHGENSILPVSTSIETLDCLKSSCYQTRPVRLYDKTRPPFSRLISLSLANNSFYDEEDLIAIAAWPTIQTLSIQGNPLIKKQQVKRLTLLRKVFVQKLGISVISQQPCVPSHHHTEIYPKSLRTVKDGVRKLPKLTVDQILSLESSKPASAFVSGRSPAAPSERSEQSFSRVSNKQYSGGYYEKEERIDSEGTAESDGDADEQKMSEEYDANQETAFFMTQPCDESAPKANVKPVSKANKYSLANEFLKRQYKEYEILFEDDEEDAKNISSIQPSKDIQQNVNALRYALDHQCTVWDQAANIKNINNRSPVSPKHPLPPKMPVLTYKQKVTNALGDLKQNTAVKEIPLSEVFSNPQDYKEDYKEAKKLLRENEKCYNQKSGEKKSLKDVDKE